MTPSTFTASFVMALAALSSGAAQAWNAYEESDTSYSRPLCIAGILNGNKAWMRNEVRSPGLMTTYWISMENRTTFPLVYTLKFTLPGTSLHIDETVTMPSQGLKSFQLGLIYKDPSQKPSPIVKAVDIFKYLSIKCTEAMGRKL